MNKNQSILHNKNYISTGNLFFDKIISGLSVGTIALFIEDSPTRLNEVFVKYLISEGLINKEKIFFMYSNPKSLEVLNTLPYKSTAVESILNAKKGSDNKSGEIKIAWRYENIKYSNVLEELAKNASYILDLSRQLQEEYNNEKVNNLVKIEISPSNDVKKVLSQINDNIVKRYSNIYGNIEEDAQKTIVKFIIPNLLEFCDLTSFNKDQTENNIKIQLQILKNLARSINGIVIITISNEELLNTQYLNLFKYFSDYVFTLKSFLLEPQKLEDYDGLLTINKMPRILSLKSVEIETDTYGLISEKKKLVIEKIDIGPEIDRNTKVKEKDTKSQVTASQAMCSSKHSKDYEF
jgi:hypothetical protein